MVGEQQESVTAPSGKLRGACDPYATGRKLTDSAVMSGRPNWYSDHPPACTCATCRGDDVDRTGDDSGADDGTRLRRGRALGELADDKPLGIATVVGVILPAHSCRSFRVLAGDVIGRAVVWVAVFAAFAAGMVWVLVNDDMRSGIGDWLSVQLGATPTPAPVSSTRPGPPHAHGDTHTACADGISLTKPDTHAYTRADGVLDAKPDAHIHTRADTRHP